MKRILLFCLLLAPLSAVADDIMKSAGDAMRSVSSSAAAGNMDFSSGLSSAIASALGVSSSQADGGLGSLFSLAKSTLGNEQFATLASAVPGMDTLLKAAPALEGSGSSLSSLAGGLGDYGEAVKGASQVYSQFQALGLDATAVPQYIEITNSYLQSTGGKKAAELFSQGVASLL